MGKLIPVENLLPLSPSARFLLGMKQMFNFSLTDVPCVSSSSMVSDLRALLEEADQGDTIHDVLIKVNFSQSSHTLLTFGNLY